MLRAGCPRLQPPGRQRTHSLKRAQSPSALASSSSPFCLSFCTNLSLPPPVFTNIFEYKYLFTRRVSNLVNFERFFKPQHFYSGFFSTLILKKITNSLLLFLAFFPTCLTLFSHFHKHAISFFYICHSSQLSFLVALSFTPAPLS